MEFKCRHFNGVHNGQCKAGKEYLIVRDTSQPGMARFPCICADIDTCGKRDWLTQEELDAEQREMDAAVVQMVTRWNSGLCIECGQPVERMRQVGRSVYAEPCGHRNGQANAKAWQKRQDERKAQEVQP